VLLPLDDHARFRLVDHGHFNRIGLYDPFTEFRGQISFYLQTVLARPFSFMKKPDFNRILTGLLRLERYQDIPR
jgi:hypothetical protein